MYGVQGAVEAGVDLEMPGPGEWRGKRLAHAVAAKRVNKDCVDDRARAVLNLVKKAAAAKIQGTEEEMLDRPEDRALLREAAAESIVLMKNDESILPFDVNKPIAIIGPNGKVAAYRGGRVAHLRPYHTVTPFDAIAARAQADVHFEQGIYNHFELPLLGAQMRTKTGQVGYDMNIYSGPPGATPARRHLDHYELLNSCGFFFNYPDKNLREYSIDIEGTFTPDKSGVFDFGVSVQGTANLYVDGTLLIDNTTHQKRAEGFFRNGTVEETGSMHVTAGQTYQILCRWNSPTTSTPDNTAEAFKPGNIRLGGCHRISTPTAIASAAHLASTTAQVVVLAGSVGEWESEGNDRKSMTLPPHTDTLISAVLAANPSAAICISSGGPYTMPWLECTKALLQVWYGGNETGNAIADVLFGVTNPSGKLPLSFPRRLEENPAFLCSHADDGGVVRYNDDVYVGYRYYDTVDQAVLFPFGHGLSYTSFVTSDATAVVHGDVLQVACLVRNVGERRGKETVQVYVQKKQEGWRGPVKQLRGFEKVEVESGETREVRMELDLWAATAVWREDRSVWVREKGKYGVLVGGSSRAGFAEAEFALEVEEVKRGL
jgi:beta-glucosidase